MAESSWRYAAERELERQKGSVDLSRASALLEKPNYLLQGNSQHAINDHGEYQEKSKPLARDLLSYPSNEASALLEHPSYLLQGNSQYAAHDHGRYQEKSQPFARDVPSYSSNEASILREHLNYPPRGNSQHAVHEQGGYQEKSQPLARDIQSYSSNGASALREHPSYLLQGNSQHAAHEQGGYQEKSQPLARDIPSYSSNEASALREHPSYLLQGNFQHAAHDHGGYQEKSQPLARDIPAHSSDESSQSLGRDLIGLISRETLQRLGQENSQLPGHHVNSQFPGYSFSGYLPHDQTGYGYLSRDTRRSTTDSLENRRPSGTGNTVPSIDDYTSLSQRQGDVALEPGFSEKPGKANLYSPNEAAAVKVKDSARIEAITKTPESVRPDSAPRLAEAVIPPSKSPDQLASDTLPCTIFVEGLPADCTRREVAHIFRPFIGYKQMRVIHKEPRKTGGEPYVLCFVEFVDEKSALTALNALQGYKFDASENDSNGVKIQLVHFPGTQPSSKSDSKASGDDEGVH